MTKEEYMLIFKEIGIDHIAESEYWHPLFIRFGELVAQHEREECIKIVTQGTGEAVQARTLNILNKERMRIANAIRNKKMSAAQHRCMNCANLLKSDGSSTHFRCGYTYFIIPPSERKQEKMDRYPETLADAHCDKWEQIKVT